MFNSDRIDKLERELGDARSQLKASAERYWELEGRLSRLADHLGLIYSKEPAKAGYRKRKKDEKTYGEAWLSSFRRTATEIAGNYDWSSFTYL